MIPIRISIKRHAWATLGGAMLLAVSAGTAQIAWGQTVAPQGPGAPIVKPPPAAASGAASATNPDNMPVKKPRKPTNDDMSHSPPASATNAK
ncbi:hypothetical protein ACFQ3P_36690 [Paraburkholderia sabiae]|uniref:Uncharacterized protein n=1 Tax=Paraburkholderia sabiae TaxID=273251 RepID=A0ABU9QNP6_9BURK|nr:hypothetical protein [Paraburkholderia sabiae]WJZ72934.1 hypothetical protein QEN71_22665 [Paraburkholderia sabiae]CAD6562260.1 hypothetical protein LMG24235_07600 [Paraburkholderia sabiae]